MVRKGFIIVLEYVKVFAEKEVAKGFQLKQVILIWKSHISEGEMAPWDVTFSPLSMEQAKPSYPKILRYYESFPGVRALAKVQTLHKSGPPLAGYDFFLFFFPEYVLLATVGDRTLVHVNL